MPAAPAPAADAIARLRALVAADDAPTLDQTVLVALLEDARRPDADGRQPTDTGWVPTYAWARAAADGWLRKAARAASKVNFQTQKMSVYNGQLHTACMKMADFWGARADAAGRGGIRSVALTSATAAAAAELEAGL